ncbi:hypothetical protein WR164_02520 [Philodulcilactobacillus myokoensis]|uniref:Uncharacterized protein n=2 Tax=Philodulcilactobacillus myokoensis TaxID=2929573 RepID=A0A9W6B0M5_9LACO|nr:hypothetical protein [Philodulcilactobacillus myokoensis]GLB46273.1 hypothetical protein WR164_02520 [Philodulcilactobacillus myokoensis]
MNYVLIDDANEFKIDYLYSAISLLDEYDNLHFIVTIRNYAVDNFRHNIKDYEYKLFNLEAAKRKTVESIINEDDFISKNPLIKDKILNLSHSNPRQAIIAVKLVKLKGENILNNSNGIMINYYSQIIKDANISDSYLKTLFIIAVFNKIKYRDESKIDGLIKMMGLNHNQFVKNIIQLSDKEICNIYQKEVASISDQSLKDYVLYLFLFGSKKFTLNDLLSILFNCGFSYLLNALEHAKSVKFSNDERYLLKNAVYNFYRHSGEKLSKQQKIEFLKEFGNFLESDVLRLGIYLADNVEIKNRNINFNLNQLNQKYNNTQCDNFLSLLKILLKNDFKKYYGSVIELSITYLQRDNSTINIFENFFVDMFGIDPILKDQLFHLRLGLPIFHNWIIKSIPIINECLLFTMRGILKPRGSKTVYINDTYGIVNYHLNDSLFDEKILKQIFDILKVIANQNKFPKNSLLKFIPNNLIYDKHNFKITKTSLRHILKIASDSESMDINKYDIDFIKLEIVHIDYLAGKISLNDVIKSFNPFQKCFWIMNNYCDKNQYGVFNENLLLNDYTNNVINKLNDFAFDLSLCLNSNLSNSSSIRYNFANIVKLISSKEKHDLLKELLKIGLKNVNYLTSCVIVEEYGIVNFLNDFKDQYKNSIMLMYFVYSTKSDPTINDVDILFDLMSRLDEHDWLNVSYENMNSGYQKNTKIIDLFVDKTIEYSSYDNFQFNSKESADNIFNNVSSKNKLIKCYLRGFYFTIVNSIDIDFKNNLFLLIKDDSDFQRSILNLLFNKNNQIYWNNTPEIYLKMSLLWESSFFRNLIKEKIYSKQFNPLNSAWNFILHPKNYSSDNWLLSNLKITSEINEAQNIMQLINLYFSYDKAIPFFKVIASKHFSLNKFKLYKIENSWFGSEIPSIKENISFIKKITPFFSSAEDILYLNTNEEILQNRIRQVTIDDYVYDI